LGGIEAAVSEGRLGRATSLAAGEREVYRELLRILGSGEASCIACAKARGGVVVTDDKTARDCCAERGVAFTGTIGILKACALDGTLSPGAADAVLQAMIDAGYYSPVTRISGLL
jgi:predicted nucleic acid-binding protein